MAQQKTPAREKGFQVIATESKVYGSIRRRSGTKFTIAWADHFDPNWMKRDGAPAQAPADIPRMHAEEATQGPAPTVDPLG